MDLRIGDRIFYIAFGGVTRYVLVTEVHADVKNGRPGFDAVVINGPDKGEQVWGYTTQVERIYCRG